MNRNLLLRKAQDILSANWRNGFTIPTARLYPFQWFWDSGFVALGWSHFDLNKAMTEINSLLKGQWKNGMIPHIIFHSETETTYFPNWYFWDSAVNPGAPKKVKTSGITQPPVLGFIIERIWKNHLDNENVRRWVKHIFPRIVDNHRFFYKSRDPNHEGLFYIYHPWESGRDNSPIWDDVLNRIDLSNTELPDYKRRDTQIADSSERPTKKNYDQYVYLLLIGKKYTYDSSSIYKESEFAIQDAMMNAILIRSNQALIEIGESLGLEISEVKEWHEQSSKQFEKKLWSEEIGAYVPFDLKSDKQIKFRDVGGLSALFSGVTSEDKAAQINEYLSSLSTRGFLLCPSFDVDHEYFDSKRYWRGPVWPQMNWLLARGLETYGFKDTAQIVKNDLIHLVDRFGFYEYFEAQRGHLNDLESGYGGNHFSWTASSIIDFIKN